MGYFNNYLSEEQAADILQHLVRQLATAGLSDVVESIQESLALIDSHPQNRRDTAPYQAYPRTSRALLDYYLAGAIDYLQNVSSHHYQAIRDGIASNLSFEGERLHDIRVRFSPLGNETSQLREVSLSELPDYSSIISSLQNTKQQLSNYGYEPG